MCRIAVIGAGVVGASVAFRLAQGGADRVWLVDRSLPGTGASSASFAWVNAKKHKPFYETNYPAGVSSPGSSARDGGGAVASARRSSRMTA
jgi:glycine/D-amino acid oxidase-like deaminating enzyme